MEIRWLFLSFFEDNDVVFMVFFQDNNDKDNNNNSINSDNSMGCVEMVLLVKERDVSPMVFWVIKIKENLLQYYEKSNGYMWHILPPKLNYYYQYCYYYKD